MINFLSWQDFLTRLTASEMGTTLNLKDTNYEALQCPESQRSSFCNAIFKALKVLEVLQVNTKLKSITIPDIFTEDAHGVEIILEGMDILMQANHTLQEVNLKIDFLRNRASRVIEFVSESGPEDKHFIHRRQCNNDNVLPWREDEFSHYPGYENGNAVSYDRTSAVARAIVAAESDSSSEERPPLLKRPRFRM